MGQLRATPLRLAVGQIAPSADPQRDHDPDRARQLGTVKALLRLGAGTLPYSRPPPLAGCSPPPTHFITLWLGNP